MDSDVPMASGDVPPNPQSAAVATGGVGAEQDLLGDDEDEDEDEMLRRAMALSRGENPSEDVTMADVEGDDDEEDEETAIARAIAMSLEEDKKGEDKESK
jgi:26S proteasome regulatory subunit N10